MSTIEDVLDRHGIIMSHSGESTKVTTGWVGIVCPRCGIGTGIPGCGIHTQSLAANCWKCGPIKIAELFKLLSIPLDQLGTLLDGRDFYIPERKPRGKLKRPIGVSPLGEPHKRYLHKRGFDPAEITKLWGVQGIGLNLRLAWRLYLPIHDSFGNEVSWTTRATSDDCKVRYLSARPDEEAVEAKTLLYGEQYCRHSIVVCEGPLDAWAIGPGAVATLGVSWTQAQALKILKYPERIICFDSEGEAQARARKLCAELAAFPGETRVVTLETDKDPASADRKEIQELRRRFLR